jgi:uncharacterized protein YneF (UPF0154 family)
MKKKSISLLSVVVFIMTLIVGSAIFGDWEYFKRGLKGEPPVEKGEILK